MRFPKSPLRRAIVIALLSLVPLGFVGWVLYGNAVLFWIDQRVKINALRDDPDPLISGLARGDIREGSPVEDLIAKHPPEIITRRGRYTQLIYANHVVVMANDGRLASAVATGGKEVLFFNNLTSSEHWQFAADIWTDYRTERRLNEEQSDWHRYEDDRPHSAVAGVAGYTSTAGWFRERAGLQAPKQDAP